MDKYVKSTRIGYGTTGDVHRGHISATNEPVILRDLRILEARDGIPINFIKEFSFLTEIKHKNILRLLEATSTRLPNVLCLVYEALDQNYHNILSVPNIVSDPDLIKTYIQQILSAVARLHSLKTCHQDLKPENVLVNIEKKTLKVADLGLRRALAGSFDTDQELPSSFRYSAPELLLGQGEYSYPIDIWSVGCIFAELLKGEPLFQGNTGGIVIKNIFRTMGVPNEETWPGITSMYPSLPAHTEVDVKTMEERFPGLEPDGIDLVSQMLRLDPRQRITAKDALRHQYFANIQ